MTNGNCFEEMEMPLLPLRRLIVFPYMTLHLDASRAASVKAVEHAMKRDQRIYLVSQRNLMHEKPEAKDLYTVGTVAKIKQLLKLPGNAVRILAEALYAAKLVDMRNDGQFIECITEKIESIPVQRITKNHRAKVRQAYSLFEEYIALNSRVTGDMYVLHQELEKNTDKLTFAMCANLNVMPEIRQDLLETRDVSLRIQKLIELLTSEIEVLKLEISIQHKVREKIDKNQREYFLREQMKVIQGELGERENVSEEVQEYMERLKATKLEGEAKEKVLKEINRLYLMPSGSHEATVIRTFLDTVLDLPWNTATKENINLDHCEKILDRDHYGLTKIKERIVEYLAVKKQTDSSKSTVLCLVGPPGVGKTTIVMSIAKAINRNFASLSLGGIRDEADIRGHRRTYIGAMPGRIINAVKLAKSSNPIILMDEIDKMTSDFRGDPAAALLEVLDREQNQKFRDHYLEIPFDLSEVMFITTANTTATIPPALLDRMEVIEISSFTTYEKLNIASKHLLKKQLLEHGVTKGRINIDKKALNELILYYTREAGVRNLERRIADLVRKGIYHLEKNNLPSLKITGKDVPDFLGPREYIVQSETDFKEPGIATGLAYTSFGGALLNIEVNILEGGGKIKLTGHLGDVMKESAYAAVCYIRSKSEQYNIDKEFYKTKDIHIHVPEGATPKDGPSAGITMATAVVSALCMRPVRSDIAMTGEVTIRGRVLAIGGLKEKSLAAHRAGIKRLIIPFDNQKDIEKIPAELRADFDFIPVKTMDEVLEHALTGQ